MFDDPVSGARAFARLMYTYRYIHNLKTANQIVSRYAPSDDCVGSIGKPPNCPYGVNPVQEYADHIAKALGVKTTDDIQLFNENKKMNIKVAIPLFVSFSQFELSDKYQPDEEIDFFRNS
jgi:hypothetical protein